MLPTAQRSWPSWTTCIVGHAWVDVTPYRVAGLGMLVDAGWRGVGQPAVSYAT